MRFFRKFGATPHFLGRVNFFRGRIDDGKVKLGEAEFKADWAAQAENLPAVGYVRPHDIEVSRVPQNSQSVLSELCYVYDLGSVVRLELKRKDTGEILEAELSRRNYDELSLRPADTLYVTLQHVAFYIDGQLIRG
ncbi:TOBE-like domain-containing protein [Brevibacillus composti]|uniref:TOBE-like domain-containing protein n=1 Tax=Brevibacillus composti TaxID=2796470 RepID=A0ABX7Z8R7_9BACL|nr:TOBE-like domain-containing protein [Brevibacillus composti]QUO43474.1 TOBE-like domain-containing protein [Brevibacillus composti]